MPNPEYALTMARYNRWQNQNLLQSADRIGAQQRARDRGAFFGSIENTLHHLYWADRIWLGRFTQAEPPAGSIADSVRFDGDWQAFCASRAALDDRILAWAKDADADWFEGDLSWHSAVLGRQITKPRRMLVMHLFNHQTHHRGQIHAMLTAAGDRPGDTDIPFMPSEYETA